MLTASVSQMLESGETACHYDIREKQFSGGIVYCRQAMDHVDVEVLIAAFKWHQDAMKITVAIAYRFEMSSNAVSAEGVLGRRGVHEKLEQTNNGGMPIDRHG